MSTLQTSSLNSKPTMRWSSLTQLVLSALAAILLIATAGIIALVSLMQIFTPTTARSDPIQSFMSAASLAFAGVLVLPSAWYSWKSIATSEIEPLQKPQRPGFGLILTITTLVLVPAVLLLGNWVSQNSRIDWLLLPPLNIIATGLPALWLVYLGTRGLPLGSPKRRWGVFASGLVLGPLIILILELIVLIGMGLLAILWLMANPSLSSQLNNLVIRLQNSSSNPEAILRILLPFLLNPGILFIGFAFIAVIVPMIEETLKPLGVWFLAGQKLTPTDGFVYGVLSGAGFGLFENLGNTSNGGETWALLASARISALLLHCFTAGLVGWALVSAWSQRRYLRLGICYMLAVLVHGLWNGMALLSVASSLQGVTTVPVPAILLRIGTYSDTVIIALGIMVLVFYIGFNAVLRRNLPGMNNQSPLESLPPDRRTTPSISSNAPDAQGPSSGSSSSISSRSSENPLPSGSNTQYHPIEGNPPTLTDTKP